MIEDEKKKSEVWGFCSQISLGTTAYATFLFHGELPSSQRHVQDADVLRSRDVHHLKLGDHEALNLTIEIIQILWKISVQIATPPFPIDKETKNRETPERAWSPSSLVAEPGRTGHWRLWCSVHVSSGTLPCFTSV